MAFALALFVLVQSAPMARPQAQARATVRIVEGTRGGKDAWKTAGRARAREIRRTDERGRSIVIRVIENE